MLQVELGVDDLVPDDGDPGAGDEAQDDGVEDHEDDPEDDVWPGTDHEYRAPLAGGHLVLKEVRMRMAPMQVRITKLATIYLG